MNSKTHLHHSDASKTKKDWIVKRSWLVERGACERRLNRQPFPAAQRLSAGEWLNKLCFHRSGMHMLKNQHSCFSCCKRFGQWKQIGWQQCLFCWRVDPACSADKLVSPPLKKKKKKNSQHEAYQRTQLHRELWLSGLRLLGWKKILPTLSCAKLPVVC